MWGNRKVNDKARWMLAFRMEIKGEEGKTLIFLNVLLGR